MTSRIAAIVGHLWREITHRPAVDRDLDDEVDAYIGLLVDERVRRGENPDRARREVRTQLGGLDHVKDAVRDTRRTASLESLWRDVTFAARALRRTPTLAAAVLLTLALGIGGTTAVFTIMDTVLLRPVPGVRDPSQLITLERLQRGEPAGGFSYPDFADYRLEAHALDLASSVGVPLAATFDGREPERLHGALVSANYFEVLGVRPSSGRLFVAGDSAEAGAVVLSEPAARRLFGTAAAAPGSRIMLDGQSFTVLGVAREFLGATIGAQVDAWATLATQPVLLSRMSCGILQDRSAGWLQIAGRIHDSVSGDVVQPELSVLAARLSQAHPATNSGRTVRAVTGFGLDGTTRSTMKRLFGLMASAALLLLIIACANVTGLLVVRSQLRERELATRVMVGASRMRVVRQLLVEGMLLAAAAGILSVGLAVILVRVALTAQPPVSLLHAVNPGFHVREWIAVGVATILVACVITLAPAARVWKLDANQILRGGRIGASASRARLRRLLVVGQVAAAFALLTVSAVVGTSVRELLSRDPGFSPSRIAVASIDLTAQGYSAETGIALYHRLIARLQSDPMLAAASFAKTVPPLDWSDRVSVFPPDRAPSLSELRAYPDLGFRVYADPIAPDYFRTLGVRIVAGREFSTRDDRGAAPVVVVNESLAKALWPNESPIGQRISWPDAWAESPHNRLVTIVGVVADHQYTSLTSPRVPTLYYPVLQEYDGRATVVARARGSATEGLLEIRRAIRDVDPLVPVTSQETMTARMEASVWSQRLLGAWLATFGGLALALSFVGLYGVVAQIVAHRTQELSLRLALGASPAHLVRGVVGEGAALMIAGIALGVPIALAAVRHAAIPLSGMQSSFATGAGGATLVLVIAMLLATLWPARRAAQLDPAGVLRGE